MDGQIVVSIWWKKFSCVSDIVVAFQIGAFYIGLLVLLNSWGGDRNLYVNVSALRWISLRISIAPLDSVNGIFLKLAKYNKQPTIIGTDNSQYRMHAWYDMHCRIHISTRGKGNTWYTYAWHPDHGTSSVIMRVTWDIDMLLIINNALVVNKDGRLPRTRELSICLAHYTHMCVYGKWVYLVQVTCI